ncbi:MAG: hypothetical protein Q4D57_04295 [Clostridia bacterium]|nr:hypothetical protein [Clostridia bacterium]
MKIITMCGSMRFSEKMREISEKLELGGNCVLTPVFPPEDEKKSYTKQEEKLFDLAHKERIKLSDAIFVVNVDNYIGSSTKSEIEFAKSLGKEIIYYMTAG